MQIQVVEAPRKQPMAGLIHPWINRGRGGPTVDVILQVD